MNLNSWLALVLNTIVKPASSAPPPETFNRITMAGDRRTTIAGDTRIVE